MSIIDFIAVVSFGLTCFCIGYTLGKDNHKPIEQEKIPLNEEFSTSHTTVRTVRYTAVQST